MVSINVISQEMKNESIWKTKKKKLHFSSNQKSFEKSEGKYEKKLSTAWYTCF